MSITSRVFGRMFELPPAETYNVAVERDLKIPMPDGVVLLADRYLPRGGDRLPLVLVRTPYGRYRTYYGLLYGRLFAERGFQVLVQSVRGTAGSGGDFDPFGRVECSDGLATLDWMRRQPWYPGSFGTAGPCYVGMAQWAIADAAGPEHKAMTTQITASDCRSVVYDGDAFCLEMALGWTFQLRFLTKERQLLNVIKGPLAERRLRRALQHPSVREMDRLAVGQTVPYFQDWLANGDAHGEFWRGHRFTGNVRGTSAPVNLLSGWYDFLLPSLLRDYAELREQGAEPYLTIGPWRHVDGGCVATGIRESLGWLRAYLTEDASTLRTHPVRIFVTGAEEWRDLPSWPPKTSEQRWFLRGEGKLSTEPSERVDSDRYTYDPSDPTPSLGGSAGQSGEARVDNQPLESRPDVLTYTSAPLDRDMDVMGQVSVDLFVSSDREYTDFFARLCEVDPSGLSLNVCDRLLRVVPGRPLREPDGTLRVRMELWPTAHRFRRGNRLRLQISSGAYPRYSLNPGTGDDFGSAGALLAAHQAVHHAPERPSAVMLPVVS